ncbi:MAG: Hpt domain-containing protein, partial [Myxococcota bacterium]
DFGDDPDMLEIVVRFVTTLPDRGRSIRQAAEADDRLVLSRLAHQLKGCAAGYGFPSIGEAAAGLESTCKEPQASADERSAAAERLSNLLDRARLAERRAS